MPATPARPGSVTFVAIMLILLGILSLLGAIHETSSLLLAVLREPPAQVGPEEMFDGPTLHRFLAKDATGYFPIMFVMQVGYFILSISQILCGIGLMKLKPAARKGSFPLIACMIVFSIAANTYQLFLVPSMLRLFSQGLAAMMMQGPGPPPPPNFIEIVEEILTYGLFAYVAGIMLVQVVLGLIMIMLLNSATAKAAFDPAPPPRDDDADAKPRERSGYEGYDDDGYSSSSPPETGITDRS